MEKYFFYKNIKENEFDFLLKTSIGKKFDQKLLTSEFALDLEMKFLVTGKRDVNLLKGYHLIKFFGNESKVKIDFGKLQGVSKSYVRLTSKTFFKENAKFFEFFRFYGFTFLKKKGLFYSFFKEKKILSFSLGDLGEFGINDYGFDLYKWEPRLLCRFSFREEEEKSILVFLSYFDFLKKNEKIL